MTFSLFQKWLAGCASVEIAHFLLCIVAFMARALWAFVLLLVHVLFCFHPHPVIGLCVLFSLVVTGFTDLQVEHDKAWYLNRIKRRAYCACLLTVQEQFGSINRLIWLKKHSKVAT